MSRARTELEALALLVLALATCVALLVAEDGRAAFGDNYGIADVNVAGAQESRAFPGTSAFWAGTCDLASAPIGDVPHPGVGPRPDYVWAPEPNAPPANPYPDTGDPPGRAVPAPAVPDHCIDWGRIRRDSATLWTTPPAWRLPPVTQAGAHPDGTATMWFRRNPVRQDTPEGSVDNIYVDLPAGFAGDPTAVPKCTAEQFVRKRLQCPPQTQVGVITLYLWTSIPGNAGYGTSNEERLPVYNLEPRRGNVAELGFGNASNIDATSVRIVAKVRTNGDFGVTGFAAQIPASLPLLAQSITLWGTPWARSHDLWRPPQGWDGNRGLPAELFGNGGEMPPSGLPPNGAPGDPDNLRMSYEPGWGRIRPFLSNPTECSGQALSTRLVTDAYEHPGAFAAGFPDLTAPNSWKVYESPAPPVTGCEKVPFDPSATFDPSSTAADSPSGLAADITIPPNDELPFGPPATTAPPEAVAQYVGAAESHWRSDAGLATSHLDKTVVTLPEGMSINPSGATGLRGCSEAGIGLRQVGNPNLFDDSEPSCPDGSRIGTVEATTPVLEGRPNLTGDVFLGEPKAEDIDCAGPDGRVGRRPDCPLRTRMYLVLRNPERGLLAKVYGSAIADPQTGRLTATFDKNPRVPVENIKVSVQGGERGLLGMPESCGEKSIDSTFSPWSAAHGAGGVSKALSDPFTVGGDCSFAFAPTIDAGMSTTRARAHGRFSFEFTRPQGQQQVRGLTAELPPGLLARVRGVPLCRDADAAAGACPQASRIGTVDAAAGSGNPLVLEEKGEVFLTQGYKGGAYGLMVRIRGIAGPFRGPHELSPIVVRQALHVDPTTAQVRAVSDPFPLIHHGVPLRVRHVVVTVDRGRFMLNPSGCAPKQFVGRFTSSHGAQARATAPFRAKHCRALGFRPKLALRLTGRRQTRTGRHPGVRAVVTQKRGEAGIRRAEVRLPKSLALDTDNAQALCEYEDGIKAEPTCPKGSIVGRARAVSPLLERPLSGKVYFVKNVRRGASGNLIRTLPMLIVALRGEIAVNLKGTSNVKRGKLVNTFAAVPDAPVSKFRLRVRGGRNGILTVTRTARRKIDICARRQVAEADFDGHNGRRHDRNVRIKTPCKKKKGAKRGAKKRR